MFAKQNGTVKTKHLNWVNGCSWANDNRVEEGGRVGKGEGVCWLLNGGHGCVSGFWVYLHTLQPPKKVRIQLGVYWGGDSALEVYFPEDGEWGV